MLSKPSASIFMLLEAIGTTKETKKEKERERERKIAERSVGERETYKERKSYHLSLKKIIEL